MEIDVLAGHARKRMQQRGIPWDVLDRLLAYGSERHDHRGGTILIMDKAARRRLHRAGGEAVPTLLDRLRSAYAVLGRHGGVVTVGHRYKRLPNG
ncbi:MAG TPA: hypothetical protein VF104_05095 [Burkholderiales bacterium]